MTSISAFALFFALACLAAGQRLPLKEGTTVNSLMTSPVLGDLATAGGGLAGRMLSLYEDLVSYMAESTNRMGVLFVDPFMMGYYRKNADTSNATSRALLKPRITDIIIVTLYEPYVQFYNDVSSLVIGALEILADMPNWLNTSALMKTDLGKLNLTEAGLLSVLSATIKVPKKHSQKIGKLFSKAASLLPAHGYNLGSRFSRVTHEVNFIDLLANLVPMLPANITTYYTPIIMFVSSNMNTVYPMLSEFTQNLM